MGGPSEKTVIALHLHLSINHSAPLLLPSLELGDLLIAHQIMETLSLIGDMKALPDDHPRFSGGFSVSSSTRKVHNVP